MARYIVHKSEAETTFKLVELPDEQQAINYVTDLAYQAMIDGESVDLTVNFHDDGYVRPFLRMSLDMDPARGNSTGTPGEYLC